jgi:HSP20 family protein
MEMRSLVKQFPSLSALDREADGLFARAFDQRGVIAWAPALESFVRENEVVIRCDVPGVDPQDLHAKVEGQILTIAGERKASREVTEDAYAIRGVTYGRFERSIVLPEGIDSETVKATYRHGVLEITIPRSVIEHTVPVAFEKGAEEAVRVAA